jgi:3D (Asp-Asp-Asp) domain-containing protein
MPDFGIMRGFNEKLFGDKLVAGQLPTQLGLIGSESVGFIGILDLYPNAAAAYSLRKLRTLYTGNAIRVRRSSDNTETDIGFTSVGDLDTTALTSFCSGTNGFVTTWYDQSGNSRNATQTTAANQPQIVSSGSILTLNSKTSMLYTGNSGMGFTYSNLTGATSYSITSVFSAVEAIQYTKLLSIGPDSTTSGVWYTVNTGGTALEWQSKDTGFAGNGYNNLSGPTIFSNGRIIPDSITTQNLLTTVLSSSNAKMFRNGSEISYRVQRTGDCYTTTGDLILGNSPNTQNTFNGRMQEIIIWQSDQNSNISGINTNSNSYYGIY